MYIDELKEGQVLQKGPDLKVRFEGWTDGAVPRMKCRILKPTSTWGRAGQLLLLSPSKLGIEEQRPWPKPGDLMRSVANGKTTVRFVRWSGHGDGGDFRATVTRRLPNSRLVQDEEYPWRFERNGRPLWEPVESDSRSLALRLVSSEGETLDLAMLHDRRTLLIEDRQEGLLYSLKLTDGMARSLASALLEPAEFRG